MVRTKTTCGACDEEVQRGEKAIECGACKAKYHGNCSNLSETERKIMTTKTNLKWYCLMCDSNVKEILNNFEKFKKMSIEIEKNKKEIKDAISDFDKRLKACETKSTNTIADSVPMTNNNEILTRQENDLIESKKSNLIYFNIPESDCENAADRMKEDFALVNATYDDLELRPTDVYTLFRVGKKMNDRPRPLILKFISVEKKKEVLSGSGKLKLKHNNVSRDVFVSIDRTPKQREEHRKLVDELKQKKSADSNDNYVIRNGRIVKNFREANQTPRVKWSDIVAN